MSEASSRAAADVTVVLVDRLRDRREVVLGVRLALHELGIRPEPAAELLEVPHDSVVREHAPLLLERMRVLERVLRRGGMPDVRDERTRAHLLRTGDERLAPVRLRRLLPDRGRAVVGERAEADAVRLVLALQHQARRRVEQPEGRLDLVRPAGHAEEAAHGP
jgi:hypothetical protein